MQSYYLYNNALRQAENSYHIIRTDNGNKLGTCGDRYTPFQNLEFEELVNNYLERGTFESVGSLNNFEKIWATIKLDTGPTFDNIQFFLLLINGHNPGTPVQMGVIPFRLSCSNQFPIVGKYLYSTRHTENMFDMVNFFNLKIQTTLDGIPNYLEKLRLSSTIEVSEEVMLEYFKKVLEFKEPLSTQAENTITGIVDKIPKFQPVTWYDAFNAITNYLSFDIGRTDSARIKSLWFGKYGKMLQNAYDRLAA